MAGPYGQWPELRPEEGMRWHAKVKITPNFSFAKGDERDACLCVSKETQLW
jgi:hypothetical protein